MSNFLDSSANVLEEIRLSTYRMLHRLLRYLKSIMNFAVSLMQVCFVTLLYFSAVKSAYIPKEGERNTHDVVPFMDVYNKSRCQPREVLVDVLTEYPDELENIFIPSCVVLMRCAGCCNDEMLECTPTVTHNVTMEVKRLKLFRQERNIFMSFTEHSDCLCRPKREVTGKRDNHCEPCCNLCPERRRKWFVQDPDTCQCSCKYSEEDCRSKQLELNERTCRCDKPRR
ncbi:vascular endothelial growth factor Ab isoform X2 [Chanos chanos]|uniref:Vascular endothelial growth factor Ab isoform X2 n=1 Tax=Chanos chanos TaxID=29144 RepID=A0A6J2VVS1_CHACN|nr:vascular endothelial growth factor A-A-like isoform X2 [Chanos chanos]